MMRKLFQLYRIFLQIVIFPKLRFHVFQVFSPDKINKLFLYLALGQCTDLKLLEKIFKHGVIDKNIRIQDIYVLFQSVNCSTKSASQRFLWNFFKDNLSVLTTFWEPTSSLFQNCLRWSADHFCLPSDANDFKVN